MNGLRVLTIFLCLMLILPKLNAQEQRAPEQPAGAGVATTPATESKGATSKMKGEDKDMAQLHERMTLMQEQMKKIQQAQDPAERQKLMQVHMQTMRESMHSMQAMMGGGKQDHEGSRHGCCGMMQGGNMEACQSIT